MARPGGGRVPTKLTQHPDTASGNTPSDCGWPRLFTLATNRRRRTARGSVVVVGGDGGGFREYQAYSFDRRERGGSRRLRRGGDANSSAAQPDVGTSLSGLSFIKILFRACGERGERERAAEPLAREPSPPFSRHYQRTLATPSSRASYARLAFAEGLLRRADIRVVIYFLSRSLIHTYAGSQLPFVPFVCPSAHSFVHSFLGSGSNIGEKAV